MVPWPSGEAPVCKTVNSSSILLGTSRETVNFGSLFCLYTTIYKYKTPKVSHTFGVLYENLNFSKAIALQS